jgi:hypothetical protein
MLGSGAAKADGERIIFNMDLGETLELDNMLAQAKVSLHSSFSYTTLVATALAAATAVPPHRRDGAHAREDFFEERRLNGARAVALARSLVDQGRRILPRPTCGEWVGVRGVSPAAQPTAGARSASRTEAARCAVSDLSPNAGRGDCLRGRFRRRLVGCDDHVR